MVKDDSRSAATCGEITNDILMEILVRLPAYSLVRFKCVSRLWYSLISSRYFTNLFLRFSSSSKREHRVFVYVDHYMLFSSLLSNLDATARFPQLNQDLTLPGIDDRLEFMNALRGLMCFRVGRETRIVNFATSHVLSLPLIESNMLLERDSDVWNYLGYNPINDEYKVLSTISLVIKDDELRSETQVLVLGEGASWRNTKSLTSLPPPHCPHEGISINNVLYYGAWSERGCVLMSFDLNSEEFNLIELSMEARIEWDDSRLIKYQDQVAVFDDSRLKTECILDLWMLEDAGKSKWSHKVLVLPCERLRLSLDLKYLKIRGTGRSGEVTFSERYLFRRKKSIHVIYDLERNCITRVVVIEPPNLMFQLWETNLLDDVESILYLKA